MAVMLRPNIATSDPQGVILRYYSTMGRGVHYYDRTNIPEDDNFPPEQLYEVKRLVDSLGGRGIPELALSVLALHRSGIEQALRSVPSTVSILDEFSEIPWDNLGQLFSTCRVRGMGVARVTKMLHKKRPKIIPILDSVMVGYLLPLMSRRVVRGESDAERSVRFIQELKKDVDNNKTVLIELCNWEVKPYPISILRVFDILVWSALGPFRDRFADVVA